MRSLRLVAATCSIAALSAAPARADDSSPEVRALVERAQRDFDLADYTAAIEGFGRAYRLDPRPGLLFNLAQAYRLSGDCVRAARMYRNFVRLAPGSRHRGLARRQLASIEACERERLDAQVAQPQPAPPPVEGDPAPDPLAAAPAVVDQPGRGLRIGGLATLAAGGLALAVGSYYALDAQRASDEVSTGYRDGGAWADLAEIDARGRRSDAIGKTLLVSGGVAAAAGATLYYLGRRAERAAIVPVEGGGQVVMTWGF